MVAKFDPYGTLKIDGGNRILIVFHLYCCSHKLSTILMTNAENLARFVVMLTFWFKTVFNFFFMFSLPIYDWISIMGYRKQENKQKKRVVQPQKSNCHITPLTPQNGHLSTNSQFLASPVWSLSSRGSTVVLKLGIHFYFKTRQFMVSLAL